jgi:hypothetical protein
MAFRVLKSSISIPFSYRVNDDLTIVKEIGRKHKRKKQVIFYRIDPITGDMLLPLFYASSLFNTTFINKLKFYEDIPQFYMTTPPLDYQEEVINLAVERLRTSGFCFLNVFCSFGKTYVAAYLASIISKNGLATLITYPREMIQASWVGSFADFTTAKVYVVGSGNEISNDTQIFLSMDTRITSLDKRFRDKIGHLIIDEADRYCTPGHVTGVLSVEPLFVTLLTATYERDDGFHVMLDLLAGPDRIIRISKKNFEVICYKTNFWVHPKASYQGINYDDLVRQYDMIPERNAMIINIILSNIDKKYLILTKHRDHCDMFVTWLNYFFKVLCLDKRTAKLCGKIKKYNDADVIVGTISKIDIGFDEKKACQDWNGIRINVLILASTTRKIEQIAGRVFRADHPVIIDIVDDNVNVKAHYRIREKWYESRNGHITYKKFPEKIILG